MGHCFVCMAIDIRVVKRLAINMLRVRWEVIANRRREILVAGVRHMAPRKPQSEQAQRSCVGALPLDYCIGRAIFVRDDSNRSSSSGSGSVFSTSFASTQPRRATQTPYFKFSRCRALCESDESTSPSKLARRRRPSFRFNMPGVDGCRDRYSLGSRLISLSSEARTSSRLSNLDRFPMSDVM